MSKSIEIFTIGHSTRSIDAFLELLKHYNIKLVIDVRRWPTSKKFPWFEKEALEKALTAAGMQYLHYPELGGYRKEGYENFAKSKEFTKALMQLIDVIDNKIVAIMCAERFFWRCHRKFIANELSKLGYKVVHILDKDKAYEHKPNKDLQEKMNLRIWCDKKARKY